MTISVVIPTLNERAGLPATLARLADAIPGAEVIVADGGSEDDTREWVRTQTGVRLIEGARGRGPQMNAGARASGNDALLFLHADCLLPHSAGEAVRRALANPAVVGGAFSVRFPDGSQGALGVTARLITLRSRLCAEATGDQAIFARRVAFEAVGGFPDWPLFEDFALCARLKRRGRLRILTDAVTLSPRRWLAHGVGRTNALMCLLYAGYRLGVPPAALKRRFADVRPRGLVPGAGVTGATAPSPGRDAVPPGRP